MLGLPRYAMSMVVCIQTLVHSTPGWLLGLGVSIAALHVTFSIFSSLTGLRLYFGLSAFALSVSALYGVVVPLLVGAALLQSAMGASIVQGLRAYRSVQATVLTISRASERFSACTLTFYSSFGEIY